MSRDRRAALSLVLVMGVFWGLNWPAVKFTLSEIPPWTLRALGFGIGAIFLAMLARRARQSLTPARSERARLIVAGLLSVFGFNVLSAFGQLLTATTKAAIIAFTMPMWAAVFSVLFLAESLNGARVGSLVLGMLGLLVLVHEDVAGFLYAPLGPLFMLGAAVSWAAGTVVLKSREWSLAPIARAAWLVGCSAPPAVVIALIVDRPWTLDLPTAPVLLTLAYHIVFPMVICHAAWVSLVGRLPASTAAIGTLLIPVVGVFSAGLLLGDALTWQVLTALALVLLSIALTFAWSAERSAAPDIVD